MRSGQTDGRNESKVSPTPWLIDAHLDLAMNALQGNRDLREPVHVLRTREGAPAAPGRAQGTVSLPEISAGGIRICFATLLARSSGVRKPHIDYASAEQASAISWGQLSYYFALERRAHVRVLTDRAKLDAHLKKVDDGADTLAVVIAMEGADPILDPEELPKWRRAGLRLLGLAHYGPGRYAGGTGTSSGLTDLGSALLEAMEAEHVALDLAHLSDRAFWEALDAFDGAIHASHGNCRHLVPHQRQFDDNQIRAIAERGGVIGVALDAWMLAPGWIKGTSNSLAVSLQHVVDHIDHICHVTGSSRFVGIGSDLDGGFGREQSPDDLDTIADLRKLAPILRERGYSSGDITDIFHGNWLRFLQQRFSVEDSATPR